MDDKQQQMIDGAVDKPTPRVKARGKKYAAALTAWQEAQVVADAARETLVEAMREDGVEHFVLAGEHEITLKTIEESYRVKVKNLERIEDGE